MMIVTVHVLLLLAIESQCLYIRGLTMPVREH